MADSLETPRPTVKFPTKYRVQTGKTSPPSRRPMAQVHQERRSNSPLLHEDTTTESAEIF